MIAQKKIYPSSWPSGEE